MKEIMTERLILRQFKESDYDDLFEYLSQLEENEFEGYPGITYENGRIFISIRTKMGILSGRIHMYMQCSTKNNFKKVLTLT